METELNLKFQRVPKTFYRLVSTKGETLGVFETREDAVLASCKTISGFKIQEVERWEYVNG